MMGHDDTTPWDVELEPGTGTVVIGERVLLLVDAPPSHPLVAAAAPALLGGGDPTKVLDAVPAADRSEMPGFALVGRDPSGWFLVLRGAVHAEVTQRDGAVTTHRAGARSDWVRLALADPDQIVLAGLPGSGDARPNITVGVAHASGATLRLVAADRPPPAAPIAPTAESAATHEVEGPPAPEPEPASEAPAAQTRAEHPTPAAQDQAQPNLDFEHLFEETTFRPPPPPPEQSRAEPVSKSEPVAKSEPNAFDGADPTTRIFDSVSFAVQAEPPPPPPSAGGGLIDWVPGAPRRPSGEPADPPSATTGTPAPPDLPPPPAPVLRPDLPPAPAPAPMRPPPPQVATPPAAPATPGPAPDVDDTALEDATITLAALRAARSGGRPDPAGPMVSAVNCPRGHPNPTHNDRCRACGGAIVDRVPLMIARPSLGRLRFADGSTAELDRHLLIGRNPSTDLQVNGEATGVVRLADPDSVLSRTHVAIQLDGWQVQVIDRDSMNHTYVEIPGRPPFQIRPGEPYPVPPGSTIRLGDEIGFVFEADVS